MVLTAQPLPGHVFHTDSYLSCVLFKTTPSSLCVIDCMPTESCLFEIYGAGGGGGGHSDTEGS